MQEAFAEYRDRLTPPTGALTETVEDVRNAMAAGGYVTYCKNTSTYRLEPEQAVALADSNSPAFVPGLFQVTAAMWAARPKIGANFRGTLVAFVEIVLQASGHDRFQLPR